jgi:outer membrane protein assembly factor BamB
VGRTIGERDESQPDEWPTLGQNPKNTKFNPGGVGPKEDPDIDWTVDSEGIFAPPVISDGTIALNGVRELLALNSDGTQRWNVEHNGPFDDARPYPYSSLVTEDIVCSSIWGEDGPMKMVAYSHTGNLLWEIDGSDSSYPLTPLITYSDGTLYASTRNDIQSINPSDGEVLWSAGDTFIQLVVTDDLVLAHPQDDSLVTFSKDNGEREWEFDTLGGNIPRPVVNDETVFVAYGNDMVGLNLEDGSISMEATDSFGGEFAFVDDVIIEPDEDTLRAYDLQREEVLWEQEYSASLNPPAIADGVAYVGGEDKRIRGIEIASGDELWSRQLEDDVMRPVVAQGRVLAVSGDTLYSLS